MHTELIFKNHSGGEVCYIVTDILAKGGSSTVYNGYYVSNSNQKKRVRIKEITTAGQSDYEENLKRQKEAFCVANKLMQKRNLTNSIFTTFDIYEVIDALYIVSPYVEGQTLACYNPDTLEAAVRIVLSLARIISGLHDEGYLYLDLKPENIWVLPETTDLVMIFDFDTVVSDNAEALEKYKIAYSEGFAPIEQKMGSRSRIGKQSDIYSLGAILFYALFGTAPTALDCDKDGGRDYTSIKFQGKYRDKLFTELDIFFSKTLCSYEGDRYQRTSEVIEQLVKIIAFSRSNDTYIVSSKMINADLFFGRELELKTLENWFQSEENIIFVTGMGGIGKSTLVRQFVIKNREEMDAYVYLNYRDSIMQTVADDNQFYINNCQLNPEETTEEYFHRKMKYIKELSKGLLVVVDNYCGYDDNLTDLLEIAGKVIVISRASAPEQRELRVSRIGDKANIYEMFSLRSGKQMDLESQRKLDEVIELVDGHTLVLELIARQIKCSFMSINEALELVKSKGFSDIAMEKVDYYKDGARYYAKISSIISAVYNVETVSDSQRKILKLLSLFSPIGINAVSFKRYYELSSLDEINELKNEGWIELFDERITLHPLISETISNIPWNEKTRLEANRLMRNINERSDFSRCLLVNVAKDNILKGMESYEKLLLTSIRDMPLEEEDFIIEGAEYLLERGNIQDKYNLIELMDYISYLYNTKKEKARSQKLIKQAYAFAKKQHDHYIWGVYYDMLTDYDDFIIGGNYYDGTRQTYKLINRQLKNADKAIKHMRKSTYIKAQHRLGRYIINKANIMIRCFWNQTEAIKALLEEAKSIAKPNEYYFTKAWYYTLCEENLEKVLTYLEKSHEITKVERESEIEEILYYIIPAANMMSELCEHERSIVMLEQGIAICDNHPDVLPFQREKEKLLSYIQEEYYYINRI